MTTNPQHPGARPGIWVAAFLALATSVAIGQLNRSARLRNLVYPDYNERAVLAGVPTNQLKGKLFLAEGEYLPSGLVLGKAMQLEQYNDDGRTNLVARAPECLYNPSTRIAWSTGRLEIIAMDGRFVLAGRHGFEANQTNTTLVLSNRVRTVLQQNLLKPMP